MTQRAFLSRFGLNKWTDWLGVTASIACAIHCAAMPFVAVFLPMLGLSFLMDDSFHQVMVVVCSSIAIAAFIPGFRRHRRLLPICVGAIGLSLISTAAFALEGHCCQSCAAVPSGIVPSGTTTESAPTVCTEACCDAAALAAPPPFSTPPQTSEVATASTLGPFIPWITPLGGLLLVAAHLTNRQFSCRCGCCPKASNADTLATVD